jgi:hypothetical protein
VRAAMAQGYASPPGGRRSNFLGLAERSGAKP